MSEKAYIVISKKTQDSPMMVETADAKYIKVLVGEGQVFCQSVDDLNYMVPACLIIEGTIVVPKTTIIMEHSKPQLTS